MPLFNDEQIFGTCVKMRRQKTERAGQRNAYGGLDGVEHIDLGARGRFTTVSGRHVCPSSTALNAAQILFESYQDGNAYILVDQFGNSWPNVMLIEFTPTGDLNQIFGSSGGFTQAYSARFEHLSD